MTISRRDAMRVSGTTLAGISLGLGPTTLLAQAPATAPPPMMRAWMMNDQPLTPQHGAPIRLVVPFRYGARSIKAITDMSLGSTGMPTTQLPQA